MIQLIILSSLIILICFTFTLKNDCHILFSGKLCLYVNCEFKGIYLLMS